MIPILFKIGPLPVASYGLMLVIGFICAYFLLELEFKKRGVSEDFVFTEILLGLIGAFVGSRLFHVMDHLEDYSTSNLMSLIKGPGNSWYGGFILASILILWAGRKNKISWTTLVDASAPAIAIGYGFGRIGCFISGDGCYGEPCSSLGLNLPSPLCMSFPNGLVPTTDIVLNTPLIEAAGAVITFAILMILRNKLKKPASLFGIFIIIHGIFRFLIEFVRLNPKVGFSFSQAQWISIFIISTGIFIVFRKVTVEPEPITIKNVAASSAKSRKKDSNKKRTK